MRRAPPNRAERIENNDQHMGFRARVISFGAAFVLVVAGVAGGVAFGGTFGQILALVLISLGLVLATALVFYEVGLSEDRERAREESKSPEREPDIHRWPEQKVGRARRRRLERLRGQRRRLR
jgi:hypothetical protein